MARRRENRRGGAEALSLSDVAFQSRLNMGEAPLGSFHPSPADRYELRFERDFSSPPEEVWRAVSSSERIGHWLSDAEVELRPGGLFRLRGQCNVEGKVLEVTPPTQLRWTWPHPEHPRSEVRFNIFRLSDEGCRLTLVQTDLPRQWVSDVAAGWHTHLDALPRAILNERTPFDAAHAAVNYRRYEAVLGN